MHVSLDRQALLVVQAEGYALGARQGKAHHGVSAFGALSSFQRSSSAVHVKRLQPTAKPTCHPVDECEVPLRSGGHEHILKHFRRRRHERYTTHPHRSDGCLGHSARFRHQPKPQAHASPARRRRRPSSDCRGQKAPSKG